MLYLFISWIFTDQRERIREEKQSKEERVSYPMPDSAAGCPYPLLPTATWEIIQASPLPFPIDPSTTNQK